MMTMMTTLEMLAMVMADVGDGGFDEEEEKQIRIYWRAGNTLVIMLTIITC